MNEKMPTQFPWGLHSTGNCRQKKCHPSFSPEINNITLTITRTLASQHKITHHILVGEFLPC